MRPTLPSQRRLRRRLAAASSLALAVLATTGTATAATATGSAVAGSHTVRVVVRPVDRSGNPVTGWSVRRETGTTVSCQGSASAAVDDDILACFPTAAYLPACWKSHHHTALCLRDARRHRLVRVRYSGGFAPASAPGHPSPQDLTLAHGQPCQLRVGGAWAQLPSHPTWLGFYSCRHGSVYGPASGDGVDRSARLWTVRLWRSGTTDTVVRRAIARAYFVGTHR